MSYDPIATIERIAEQINETFPEAAVGLLTAATELESRLHREDGDRKALADHWGI